MASPAASKTIRVAMLNCDTPVPNVRAQKQISTYGAVFHSLLVAAAKRVSSEPSYNNGTASAAIITIDSIDFDVVQGELPTSPAEFDALLITGSASSSYDRVEWIQRLEEYVSSVYRDHPGVKIFGSCFGHQIICQALLKDHGVYVEKDPNGWEMGVQDVQLTQEFMDALGPRGSSSNSISGGQDRIPTPDNEDAPRIATSSTAATTSPRSLRMQFVHADHVNVARAPGSSLPSSWIPMGRTEHCAFQGAYQPGRILTYQGHFEFDRLINTETIKVFGAKWDPAALQSALDSMDRDDDAEAAADMVIRFFLEDGPSSAGAAAVPADRIDVGGLATPPVTA